MRDFAGAGEREKLVNCPQSCAKVPHPVGEIGGVRRPTCAAFRFMLRNQFYGRLVRW